MTDDWYTLKDLKTQEAKEPKATMWGKIQSLFSEKYDGSPDEAHRWIFRGERKLDADDVDKYLRTSIEKAFDDYGIDDPQKKRENEMKIIRKFQRQASLYIEGGEPDKDDILEWLALMRHHGAPARLMDWNYSYHIAVYFALAENQSGVVWALNTAKMNKPEFVIDRIPKGKGGCFSELRCALEGKDDLLGIRGRGDKLVDLAIACYLMKNPMSLVYPVNPFRLNKRLTIQHGLFLFPGDITKPLKENLKEYTSQEDIHKITIECDKSERNEILWQLRNMNINNAVLFPGLDGFAKSTGESLAYPEDVTA